MVSLRRTVLLTGASGVVGSALIPELRAHRVVALSHRRRPPGPVAQVHGDLTKPRLGLSRQTYNTLTAQIDTVVHCGAVTDFATGARETSEVNVRGTENVVHFAAEADALLIYVSSAFVARIDTTRGQLGETSANPVHYLTSKQAAEQKVRESRSVQCSSPPAGVQNYRAFEPAAARGIALRRSRLLLANATTCR